MIRSPSQCLSSIGQLAIVSMTESLLTKDDQSLFVGVGIELFSRRAEDVDIVPQVRKACHGREIRQPPSPAEEASTPSLGRRGDCFCI